MEKERAREETAHNTRRGNDKLPTKPQLKTTIAPTNMEKKTTAIDGWLFVFFFIQLIYSRINFDIDHIQLQSWA